MTGGDTDILSSDDLDNSTTDGDSDKCETSVVEGVYILYSELMLTIFQPD